MRLFKFKELFSLTIKNDYYTGGNCPDFKISPTADCHMFMRNHYLKFKATDCGFSIWGELDGDSNNLKKPFVSEIKLSFTLQLRNPLFANFTDIPLQPASHEILYFNNLSDFETGGDLRLADKSQIPVAGGNHGTIIRPVFYRYRHSASGSAKTGTVTILDSGATINKEVEEVNGVYDFQFNLSNFRPGRCLFTVDAITEPFYLGKELYSQDVFGILDIYTGASAPSGYRFIDGSGDIHTKHYSIPFTNRSTIWRYLVYDKLTNTLASPMVNMAGTEFSLESTPASSYPDDYSLYTFTSGQPGDAATEKALPLSESALTGINLTGSINGSAKTIIGHLPNPGVTLIKPEPAEPGKIYSEIVVYV